MVTHPSVQCRVACGFLATFEKIFSEPPSPEIEHRKRAPNLDSCVLEGHRYVRPVSQTFEFSPQPPWSPVESPWSSTKFPPRIASTVKERAYTGLLFSTNHTHTHTCNVVLSHFGFRDGSFRDQPRDNMHKPSAGQLRKTKRQTQPATGLESVLENK